MIDFTAADLQAVSHFASGVNSPGDARGLAHSGRHYGIDEMSTLRRLDLRSVVHTLTRCAAASARAVYGEAKAAA